MRPGSEVVAMPIRLRGDGGRPDRSGASAPRFALSPIRAERYKESNFWYGPAVNSQGHRDAEGVGDVEAAGEALALQARLIRPHETPLARGVGRARLSGVSRTRAHFSKGAAT